MRKLGVSLVALVITIVVLVILTGAVIITGINVPAGAQLSVFYSNVSTIQDAVTMKMANNMMTNAGNSNSENLKWVGIVKDYTGTNNIDFTNGEIIAGKLALPLSNDITSQVNISPTELANYYVTEEGVVVHRGFVSEGVTYYTRSIVGSQYTMTELMSDPTKAKQGTIITISTPQELKDLATYTNGGNRTEGVTFELMNDITLNTNVLNVDGELNVGTFEEWIPIGYRSQANNIDMAVFNDTIEHKGFNGVFDGQNHNISGIYIYNDVIVENEDTIYTKGLFGCIDNGIVANVSITNSYAYTNTKGVGLISGYMYNGVIYNCFTENGIVEGNALALAGICGYTNGGDFVDCHNACTITSNQGVVGGITSGAKLTNLKNCYNTGNISGVDSVGGITGIGIGDGTIVDSYNTGIVSGTRYIGGISGQARNIQIENCYNQSTISGNTYVGGIIGVATDVQINNCNNQSQISGANYIGGISGLTQKNTKIKNCYNMHSIMATTRNAGGITGNIVGDLIIYNSYNQGTIVSGNISGGIIGGVDGGTATLINCYNNAKIYADLYTVGGCVGAITTSFGKVNVINCYNTGETEGESSVGGIVGGLREYKDTTVNIKNVYNLGQIKGVNSGGIIGKIRYIVNLEHCYNVGTITGSSNVGGIAGDLLLGKTGSISNVYNSNTTYFGNENNNLQIGVKGIITNQNITISGEEKTVVEALNDWVNANKSVYPELKNWNWDSINNIPTFIN